MKRFVFKLFSFLPDLLKVNDLNILIFHKLSPAKLDVYIHRLTIPKAPEFPLIDIFDLFKDKKLVRLFEKDEQGYRINPLKYSYNKNNPFDWCFEQCEFTFEDGKLKISLCNDFGKINFKAFITDWRILVFSLMFFLVLFVEVVLVVLFLVSSWESGDLFPSILIFFLPSCFLFLLFYLHYKRMERSIIYWIKYHFKSISNNIEVNRIKWEDKVVL